jgi:hypothetical protein
MYIFGIIQLSESSIRIIRSDIRYLPNIGHIISESNIRFKYPISGTVPGYSRKTIQIDIRPSRLDGRSENIRTIYIST